MAAHFQQLYRPHVLVAGGQRNHWHGVPVSATDLRPEPVVQQPWGCDPDSGASLGGDAGLGLVRADHEPDADLRLWRHSAGAADQPLDSTVTGNPQLATEIRP